MPNNAHLLKRNETRRKFTAGQLVDKPIRQKKLHK